MTLGVVSYALGWTIFLLPNNLIGGGVSGFASILFYATGLPMGVTYFLLNVMLLIIGTKILGTGFGGKTIYAILMTSVMLSLLPKVVPDDFIHEFALSNGKLLCTFIGGIIAGFGIGVSISQPATMPPWPFRSTTMTLWPSSLRIRQSLPKARSR